LRESLQVSLSVGSEVQKAHKQAAHEEKCIDTKRSVCDSLEEEPLLYDFAIFHVIRILEDNDARMPEDDPCHRYRPESMHGADGITAYITVTDGFHIGGNRE